MFARPVRGGSRRGGADFSGPGSKGRLPSFAGVSPCTGATLFAHLIRVKSSCGACSSFGNLYRCIGSDEQTAGQRAPSRRHCLSGRCCEASLYTSQPVAAVAELADALDSDSSGSKIPWRFDSSQPHLLQAPECSGACPIFPTLVLISHEEHDDERTE